MKLAHAIGMLLWAGVGLVCGAAEKKVKIVTTFAPAYCMAANIAGDRAEVMNLLPPHASLHDYNLTPADLSKLNSAEILVLNGAGLEVWFEKALRGVQSRPDVTVVRLADGLEKELISSEEAEHHHNHKHDHGEYNPHLWLDPVLAARAMTNILQALVAKDSENAAIYERNAVEFAGRLEKINAEYKEETAGIKGVAFLTYHNAFAYLARRYELNLVGVVEEVPEVSPSARELGQLYQVIRSKKVKALFAEPGNPSRLASQISRDGKIRLAELDPFEMGELSRDAYEKVMRKNLRTLVNTLSK